MNDIPNVALLVQSTHMSNRISTIIDEVKGASYETQDSLKFLNIIDELESNINLVIIDIDMDIDEGFSILEKVKIKNPHVPIIVLTSNNKKEIFLKSIMEGAADFILKPFEDGFLRDRVKKFLEVKLDIPYDAPQIISKSLDEYVNDEIYKANKGKYSISVLMTTFFKPAKEVDVKLENEYRGLSGDLHKNLSELFWATDVFIQYGAQSFIGVFPFCDIDSKSKIHSKIIDKFNEIKNSDVRFKYYHIANAFVTYPSEGNNFGEMMSSLTTRMKQTIDDIKSME